MPKAPLSLVEFPADDPERARHFWTALLGVELEDRQAGEGAGWQTQAGAPAVERVAALGGTVIHPGDAWAICKDSEGSPFGLARR